MAVSEWFTYMVREPPDRPADPNLQAVLDALDDEDCRNIVRALEEAMSAKEVSEQCDIPLTTTYRKLERLESATLVQEQTEIRSDGHHTMRYRTDFQEVRVGLNDRREFTVGISRPSASPEDRLADMWSAVRREA